MVWLAKLLDCLDCGIAVEFEPDDATLALEANQGKITEVTGLTSALAFDTV